MKREFKQGDRVLVRNHDLEEWQEVIFESLAERKEQSHPFIQFCPFIVKLLEGGEFWYKQCRHIDDFRTGDKVQIKSEQESEEWHDAVYACALPHSDYWPHAARKAPHAVYNNAQTDTFAVKFVRWHPSMPWADKEEPLTLEQRVEILERKLNEK